MAHPYLEIQGNKEYLISFNYYHIIKIKRLKKEKAEQVDQINRSGIFERYSAVSVR